MESTPPLSLLNKSTAHSVELSREEGENGELESFGFTIKNGRPPVISSIVPGGPADRAGLKSNNVILSVNGTPVDDQSHQSVADLIYKSCSSSVWLVVSESAEESSHFKTSIRSCSPVMSHPHRYSAHNSSYRSKSQHGRVVPILPRRSPSFATRGLCKKIDVFLHYLGPVEMPHRWVARGVSLKCIRECVKKMLDTRRQHLAVFLEVAPDEMCLMNTQNKKLINYSRSELYYCGVFLEDERYFGFVTRHQQVVVDPQVGQTVNKVEGGEQAPNNWVNHCHVFQVVPDQSTISMTFQQPGSSLKRETTSSVRSANTIVNYIRQMYASSKSPTHASKEGTPPPYQSVPAKVMPTHQHLIPEFTRVTSNGSSSVMSSSSDSSPSAQRRQQDLVDLRPPVEGSDLKLKQIFVDGPPAHFPPRPPSYVGSLDREEHTSQQGSLRCETGLETTESDPQLLLPSVEDNKFNSIHAPEDFVRYGLPPKNSRISGSLDSVMTGTTTADHTYDSAPQVGGWVASFDKLLQDPIGLQCFQQFLMGEFSDENIKFWSEVEKFRTKHPNQLKPAAKRIYTVYVDPKAVQPVNLDGSTVKAIEQQLESPTVAIFNEAQKQIYNLMRLDSYQRFKRSSLLQECLLSEMDSKPFPVNLPDDLLHTAGEDSDKVTPLQPLKVDDRRNQPRAAAPSGKKSKEGGGWFFFSRRTHSFRTNNKQKTHFGSYITQEKKPAATANSSSSSSSKAVRDKSRGNGVARVDPEPRLQEAPRGFQEGQGQEEEDHLELFNNKYGPCFGIALQEKVSKILPVPKEGTVREALYNVVAKQNKMCLDTLDIRFADSMQLVDLEAPASVLNRHYIIVKQSLDFFHAIFPGKEVPVHADQNRTVEEVMEPILAENGLDKSCVAFYMYGSRQPLSIKTYAGLLKGRKLHIKLLPKTGGVPTSYTTSSIASSEGSSLSIHSSVNSLDKNPPSIHSNTSNSNNNNNGNGNKSPAPRDEDDFFDMLMRLQSDTLTEQRSNPMPAMRPLSSSVSAHTFKQKDKNDRLSLASVPDRDRHTSDPPLSPGKRKTLQVSKSSSLFFKRGMFRTMSGSEPSLPQQVELVGSRSLSPAAPEMSLSRDAVDEVPKFTVEVVTQFGNRRRSYASPPMTSPPPPPAASRPPHRSVSPPPLQTRQSAAMFPRHASTSGLSRSTSPLMHTHTPSSSSSSSFNSTPATGYSHTQALALGARGKGRASTGSISTDLRVNSRDNTPTSSGYQSNSGTPESSVVGVHPSSPSHLDHVIHAANTHQLSRGRRDSRGSGSGSDVTSNVSFQQQYHQNPAQLASSSSSMAGAHHQHNNRPLKQCNSEPYRSELFPPQPRPQSRPQSQPQPNLQNLQKWPPHISAIGTRTGMSEEERRLLQKGEQLLEKEFQSYDQHQSYSLSQPTTSSSFPMQRNHPSRQQISRHSPSKQWNKNGSMV